MFAECYKRFIEKVTNIIYENNSVSIHYLPHKAAAVEDVETVKFRPVFHVSAHEKLSI